MALERQHLPMLDALGLGKSGRRVPAEAPLLRIWGLFVAQREHPDFLSFTSSKGAIPRTRISNCDAHDPRCPAAAAAGTDPA